LWWCRTSDGVPDAKCVDVVGGECGWSDRSDETECAPVRPDGACASGGGASCGAGAWWCWAEDDGSPLSRAELAPDVCIGDISLPGPRLSARIRPAAPDRYEPRSLRCRECPLLRPGGGLDSPALCAKGGDRCRCAADGGGTGCWGPGAFRFRGDSPNARKRTS
jgi:hypothetical protein